MIFFDTNDAIPRVYNTLQCNLYSYDIYFNKYQIVRILEYLITRWIVYAINDI